MRISDWSSDVCSSDLLDMSRLEGGGLVPQPRDFPLAEVLEPLASEFGAIAAARGLAFRFVGTSAWVHSDPQLLRRCLQNSLANAVPSTAVGGVLLGLRRDNDRQAESRGGKKCV